jgi:hypothetical protein
MQVSGHSAIDPAFKINLDASKPPSRDYDEHPMYTLFTNAKTGDKFLRLSRAVVREVIVNKHNIKVLALQLHEQKKVILKQSADILELQRAVLKRKREDDDSQEDDASEVEVLEDDDSQEFDASEVSEVEVNEDDDSLEDDASDGILETIYNIETLTIL